MPIAYVTSVSTYSNGNLNINPVTAGHLLVALVSGSDTCATTAFSGGGSWNMCTNRSPVSGIGARIGYCENATGGNTTVAISNPPADCGWSLHEYSGNAISSCYGTEAYNYRQDSHTTWGTADIITTTEANMMLVGILCRESAPGGNNWTAWNERTEHTDHVHSTADYLAATADAYDMVGTLDVTGSFDMWVCASFKSAAAISAAITGTATEGINESHVVAGGKTIVITLTGDTFIPA